MKRLFKVCVWEGAGDLTELKYFDPNFYGRQHCVFLVLLMLNQRPWDPLCWVLAFFTASYQHLLWTPIHQGPKPLRPGVAFPTTSTPTGIRTQLSYIIVQCPLDLWNRMFDRHQAEITVMQFRGHSLPVHQSMSVLLECVTSFRCITLEWHFFAGSKVKIQHYYYVNYTRLLLQYISAVTDE